ncbi:MAG: hypothetical protein ACR2RB_10335 [Gammaproteobacteria bacterium]
MRPGQLNEITGTNEDDYLLGTNGRDLIEGLGGAMNCSARLETMN